MVACEGNDVEIGVCVRCRRACVCARIYVSLCLSCGPIAFVSDFGIRFDEVAVDSGHSSNRMQMTSSFIRETEINCCAIFLLSVSLSFHLLSWLVLFFN